MEDVNFGPWGCVCLSVCCFMFSLTISVCVSDRAPVLKFALCPAFEVEINHAFHSLRKEKGKQWKNNVLAFKEKVFSETVEGWNAKSSHVNPLCDLACVYSWMNFMLLWCMRCLNWHSSVDLISWTDSAPLCLDKSAQSFEFMNFHRRSAPSRLVLWRESLVAEGGILFRGICD